MTAINVWKTTREILFFTDGASWDEECCVTSFGSKVSAFPDVPAVAVGSGCAATVRFLVNEIVGTASRAGGDFGDVVRNMREVGRTMSAAHQRRGGLPVPGEEHATVRIVVGGFEKDRASIYVFKPPDSFEPVRCAEVMQPDLEGASFDALAGASGGVLIRRIVRLMEHQRRCACVSGGSVVGGFIEMTKLSIDGCITRQIVHRWRDRIGEKIGTQPAMAAA